MSSFAHTFILPAHESSNKVAGRVSPKSIRPPRVDDNMDAVEPDADKWDPDNSCITKITRTMETPPGDDLYMGDYSNIELL